MSSLVLELQKDIVNQSCDLVTALRKAHLIASKLNMAKFDTWIQNELNGYTLSNSDIPEYRNIQGILKFNNPINGWIPVIIEDQKLENILTQRKLFQPVRELIELSKSDRNLCINLPGKTAHELCEMSGTPIDFEAALFITAESLSGIAEKVTNCLLEWTINLEAKGIFGENISFNQEEKNMARNIPQQINNYYGTVINGDAIKSHIVSGNNNTSTYNPEVVSHAIREIEQSLNNESILEEDKINAVELLKEIDLKLEKYKNPNVIKASLISLRDFMISVGANITAALITAKFQGLF